MRRYVCGGLLALVAATLVACSSQGGGQPTSHLDVTAEPRASAAPTLSTSGAIVLPLAAFDLSDQQRDVLDQATSELINRCGQRFGFGHLVPTSAGGTAPNVQARRYGVSDMTVAQTYGYHPPPGYSVSKPGAAAGTDVPGDLTQVQVWILSGGVAASGAPPPPNVRGQTTPGPMPSSINGVPIPPGGCMGEADRALGIDGISAHDTDLIHQIDLEGFSRMEADSRVREVYAKWSACMSASGYQYRTVFDPLNNAGFGVAGQPSQREIDTAVADVTCKNRNNVVGIMFTVDSAYENVLIQQNLEQLTQIRNRYDAAVRKAAAALGVPVPGRP